MPEPVIFLPKTSSSRFKLATDPSLVQHGIRAHVLSWTLVENLEALDEKEGWSDLLPCFRMCETEYERAQIANWTEMMTDFSLGLFLALFHT